MCNRCFIIVISLVFRLSVQLYSMKSVGKGHAKDTEGTRALPRGHVSAANETGSTLSLRRFLHLRHHKTRAGCKCRSNTGELTSANASYSRVHSESATMKGWKSILLLTNESMPLQVKSGDYIILHCDSKHNVKDYKSGQCPSQDYYQDGDRTCYIARIAF